MIAQATAEQAEAINRISIAAQSMASMSAEIARSTKEQSAMSRRIAEGADQMRTMVAEVKDSTREQLRTAERISSASTAAGEVLQAIATLAGTEVQSIGAIVQSMEKVRNIADLNSGIVVRLDEMVQALTSHSESLRDGVNSFRV